MAPRWLNHSICCWITTVFLILTSLLVWYLWESPKQIHTSNDTNRAKRSSHSNRFGNSSSHVSIPTVCVSPNSSTIIVLPDSSITYRGQSSGGWGSNRYGLYYSKDKGWGNLICDPTGKDWRDWFRGQRKICTTKYPAPLMHQQW